MPKKFTILTSLVALSISTLGTIVPTFADTIEYHYVPELIPIHAEYVEKMAECGTYTEEDDAYKNCYNRVTNTFRKKYGGLFESMYQLDLNGRMIVTGLNPTAGTIRFYLDGTWAFRDYPYTLQNLVIFWADNTAEVSPAWNEIAGWQFVDNYLATGEIPQGYHVLYSGKKGDENWALGTEIRAMFSDDTTTEGLVHQLIHKFIHVYGYDTDGKRHQENNYLDSCLNEKLFSGGECRLQYTYNGSSASPVYINTDPADEDKTIVELKKALKEKQEAEARLEKALKAKQDAEAKLSEAENMVGYLEKAYQEAQEKIEETELLIANYQNIINELERYYLNRVEEVESELTMARNRAEEAESRAITAENRAEEIELEIDTIIEKSNRELDTTKKALENAQKSLEEARKNAAEAMARVEALLSNPTTITIYKTLEKPAVGSLITSSDAQENPSNNIPEATKNENSSENHIEVPVLGDKEEHIFPWWIIIFIFSGIALILWWFVPIRKNQEK